MSLSSQRRPWDLAAALIYTAIVSAGILVSGEGGLWALLLVLFVPGYVLVAALFPGQGLRARLRELVDEGEQLRAAARIAGGDLTSHTAAVAQARAVAERGELSEAIRILEAGNDELRNWIERRNKPVRERPGDGTSPPQPGGEGSIGLDWVERIVLSFGLSIALVSLFGLVLDLTPWGIHLDTIVVILLLFTGVVGIIAIRRRLHLPVEDRLSAGMRRPRPAAKGYSPLDKALIAVFGASIAFAAAVVAYVAITPRPQETFTQFYLLDRNGTVDPNLYPTRLNVSQPGTVIIVVVNNESARVDYTVRVDLVGVEIVRNVTSNLNDTVEVNRTTISKYNTTLDNGGTWSQSYTFTVGSQGLWEMDFLLFRTGNYPSPYRQVYFFTNVTAG